MLGSPLRTAGAACCAVVLGCAPAEAPAPQWLSAVAAAEDEGATGGALRAAPGLQLAASGPVVEGQPFDLVVTGANPGETVRLGRSTTGAGLGPCPPALGGVCLGLLPPVVEHATATADASGAALFALSAPGGSTGTSVAVQAGVLRPGPTALLSDALPLVVQPSAGGLEIVVVGQTDSVDFPVTPGAPGPSYHGGILDGFVARIDLPNSAAPALVAATYVGGSDLEQVRAVGIGPSGVAYVTGRMLSTDFATTVGAASPSYLGGGMDAFLAAYDPSGALLAASYLGGSAYDVGYGIAVDALGDVVVTGRTSSTDLPATAGRAQPAYGGGTGGAPYFGGDFFAMTVRPDATSVSWATYVGGSSDDMGRGRTFVDATGIWIDGRTESSNWPTTVGAAQTALLGSSDGAVVKLTPDGTALAWSTYIGGTADLDGATGGIVARPDGITYACGYTTSADFPAPPTAAQATPGGGFDGMVTALAADGSAVLGASFLGGSGYEECQGVALDAAGNVIVVGMTTSADFPVTANALQGSLGGPGDMYVAKLTPDLSAFLWATYLGGSGNEYADASGVWVDSDGSVVLTANTDSVDFPTTADAVQPVYGGGVNDAFVVRLSGDGQRITYGTYLGGSGDDFSRALAIHRY